MSEIKKCWINGRDDCVPSSQIPRKFRIEKHGAVTWPLVPDWDDICGMCLKRREIAVQEQLAEYQDPKRAQEIMAAGVQDVMKSMFGVMPLMQARQHETPYVPPDDEKPQEE